MNTNDADAMKNIEFVNDQERAYFAKAQLGEQVRIFLVSPAGRYLHGRAKLDYEEVKEELVECNPNSLFGRRKIRRLQAKAQHALMFMRYLADAITEGNQAAGELENYRD